MTLDNSGQMVWSEHEPIQEGFQIGLERLFKHYAI